MTVNLKNKHLYEAPVVDMILSKVEEGFKNSTPTNSIEIPELETEEDW